MKTDYSPLDPLQQVIDRRAEKARLEQENVRLLMEALRMVLVLLAAVVLFTMFFEIRMVSGNNMYPAICDGDLVLAYRNKNLKKNDVIFYECQGQVYLGRVVAKGGDAIQMDESGIFYVNGTPQTADITFPTYAPEQWEGIIVVPQDTVFVLGDFRTNTVDSRDLGAIPLENVYSKVFTLIRHRGI